MTLRPLLIAGTIAFSSALVSVQANQSETTSDAGRIIYTSQGVPIVSQLRPDDRLVQVRRSGIADSFSGAETLSDDLCHRVFNSHIGAVVTPVRTDSFLVQNGEWMQSRVTLNVVELITELFPKRAIARSGVVSFEHGGGEMQFGPTVVRTGGYYFFRSDERYLVFLNTSRGGSLVGLPLKIVSGDILAPVEMQSGQIATAPSPLYGQSLRVISAELRRLINQQGCDAK